MKKILLYIALVLIPYAIYSQLYVYFAGIPYENITQGIVIIALVLAIITVAFLKKSLQSISKPKQATSDFEPAIEISIKEEITGINIDDSGEWERVYRKTERWKDLGFGDGALFPGYGKIYDREFLSWYCDVGSKEKKNIQVFKDRFPLNYQPRDSEKIVGKKIDFEQLQNTKEYEVLFSGLDKENRKRWYFGLLKKTPTGIEADRAQD